MKTRITTFVSCLFLSINLFSQTCADQKVYTSIWDDVTELDPNDFLEGEDPADVYTITPSSLSCDLVNQITSVTIEGPNGFTCTATVTLEDNVPPVVVAAQNLFISLNSEGTAILNPETVDNGSYDNCSDVTLSISPNTFTCADIGEVEVYLTAEDAYGNLNETWTTVTVEDKLAPEIYAFNYINISYDQNGEINITPDMIEEGGGNLDNCSEVIKTVTPSFFDCNDAGEQNVILSAADENGNVTAVVAVVNLEDKLPPIPVVLNQTTAVLSTNSGDLVPSIKVFAEDFDNGSYDNCAIVDMTINRDVFTCEDIGENEVIFTVYDAAGNSNSAVVTLMIVDNSTTNTTIACNNEITYSTFQNLPYTVTPYDVLEGGPYGCNFIFYLEIFDENDDVIPNNLITAEYLGQTLTYTVFDWNSAQSCWGNIVVTDEDPGCDFDSEEDINWPLPLIELDLLNVEASTVTPEYIGNQAEYTYADAYPSIDLDSCSLIGVAYEDIVIPAGLFSYKILRQFTVIDWVNFNNDTQEGLYEFDQVIKNNNYPAWYICDTLPRSAPLGDCDSGHTFDDDVEWPNDITIADHRITPTELINYSDIALEDSEPQFSGEDAPFYTLTYQDLVGSLDADVLTIDRVWKVTHADIPGLDFTYTQELAVTFSEFSNLIAVNTHGSRAVPEVELGNNFFTDQFGKAIVEDNFFINPTLSTDPLNGIDLVDLYLARQFVLGRIEFNEYQMIAAEFNGDQQVSTQDLVLIMKTILGSEQDNIDWRFLDITDDLEGVNQVKGHYMAYRKGDVNDSALLPGESAANLTQVNLSFEDQLINNGESYVIPFYSEAMINATGIELRMKFDPSILEISEITSDMFGTDVNWDVDESNKVLTIIAYDIDANYVLDGSTALFEISAEAKENNVLHSGLDFSDTHRSFIMDEELNKYAINGSLDNGIVLGTNNNDFAVGINVYPNPTTDFINIDFSNTSIQDDYNISIYNTEGRLMHTQYNDEVIEATNFNTGSYILYISSGDNYYSQLIQVQK